MGDIVSLRLHRKRRQRSEREGKAAVNRLDHGRTKAETELAGARAAKAEKDLEGHKREE